MQPGSSFPQSQAAPLSQIPRVGEDTLSPGSLTLRVSPLSPPTPSAPPPPQPSGQRHPCPDPQAALAWTAQAAQRSQRRPATDSGK